MSSCSSARTNNFLVKTFFEIKPSSSKISQVQKEKSSIGKKTHQKCTKTDRKAQLSYYGLAVLVSKWKEKSSRASSLQTRMDLDFH
jgi:ribosomal protein L9